MKRFYLFLLVILPSFLCAQQDEDYVDELTSQFVSSLSERGISSTYINKRYCSGKVEMFKLPDGEICASQGTYFEVYVFWNENEKDYLKKIDNCGLYYTQELTSKLVSSFIHENMDKLINEKIRKYRRLKYSSKPESRKTPFPCFAEHKLTKDDVTKIIKYNLFDISTNKTAPNLNFLHNNNLAVIKLNGLLDKEIIEVEGKQRR